MNKLKLGKRKCHLCAIPHSYGNTEGRFCWKFKDIIGKFHTYISRGILTKDQYIDLLPEEKKHLDTCGECVREIINDTAGRNLEELVMLFRDGKPHGVYRKTQVQYEIHDIKTYYHKQQKLTTKKISLDDAISWTLETS